MSISPTQIIEARRLLRRGSTWLARAAHVDYRTVVSAQQDQSEAAVEVITALRRTLEEAGVEFTAEDDGRVVVRLRKPPVAA